MATVVASKKACAENPLKSSTPLGAALAYLGVDGSVPLFHGSQGCTSFALVLAVRHFKEAIPLQTTAMNEASTVLGGMDHLEEALINLKTRMKPSLIGVASTALVETRGEDFVGELKTILKRRPELAGTAVVFASTPDFEGALEDGWARATAALIDALVEPAAPEAAPLRQKINVLPGVHQTPADIEELRDTIESFGLDPLFLPDLSGSLDGHVPDAYVGTSMGGARLADIARMAQAAHTIAVGEHMRAPAEALAARAGVESTVLPSLTGLAPSDELMSLLSRLSGRPVPARQRRRRSQLVDAMLDGHFHFSGKRVAIGADPDLLYALATLFHGLGAEIVAAVASTSSSPLLARVPCDTVVVGDLSDLEDAAAAARADLLVTHSHGRQAAERLGVPLFRVGFPIFDRLGAQHRASVGYLGTRQLIYEAANLLLGELREPRLEDFAHASPPELHVEDTRHVHA
ncbi:nitrogenase iron-molybdenum cofactor biosynthesis protein NifN [Sorangium sp. So ce1024]|uniref:nitrogenase iron-molybdenum cofactor biosynthesis protein NifN n=1 Tax=unclassified Sorangium TaxID=2621164 RepID=UPI003F0E878D